MCLFVLENKERPQSDMICYKVVLYDNEKLWSPISVSNELKIGDNIAWPDEPQYKRTEFVRELRGGAIHCFTSKTAAMNWCNGYLGEHVIEVFCRRDDFITWGSGYEIAFKKIEISKSEYERIIKLHQYDEIGSPI